MAADHLNADQFAIVQEDGPMDGLAVTREDFLLQPLTHRRADGFDFHVLVLEEQRRDRRRDIQSPTRVSPPWLLVASVPHGG